MVRQITIDNELFKFLSKVKHAENISYSKAIRGFIPDFKGNRNDLIRRKINTTFVELTAEVPEFVQELERVRVILLKAFDRKVRGKSEFYIINPAKKDGILKTLEETILALSLVDSHSETLKSGQILLYNKEVR